MQNFLSNYIHFAATWADTHIMGLNENCLLILYFQIEQILNYTDTGI